LLAAGIFLICSWFGLDAINVKHVFVVTFEFSSRCYEKSWMDVSDLFVALKISKQNESIARTIIVGASRNLI
jgi:hypothetical protein